MGNLLQNWQGILWFTGALVLGLIGHYILFKSLRLLSKRSDATFKHSIVKHCRRPALLVIPLLAARIVVPVLGVTPAFASFVKQGLGLLMIASVSWLIMKMAYVAEDLILSRVQLDVADNLRARKLYTQIQIFKKIVLVTIGILALASLLMSFDKIRALGTGLLASAGIAGIVLGLAAQRSIATLLAGIQIAITQPIRIDDVVIVENEWGRIEDITMTYVVVRIWDLRRLIVPVTYFLEKPFQNWTRVSADLLGTVFLYADYTLPIQSVRERLQQILKESEFWDGKVCGLQVTNATERTVELRALMSAPDASSAWQLRCEVREKLIEFIQTDYPESLPKLRTELRDETAHITPIE